MSKITQTWRKAAFFDPATGDVVQFNHIIPDQSAWNPEPIQTEDSIGQIYGGRDYTFEVGTVDIDADKKALLQQWETAGTPIQAVVYNPGGYNILWRHGVELFLTPPAGTKASEGADPGMCGLYFTGVGADIFQRRNLYTASAVEREKIVFPIAGAQITASVTSATNNNEMNIVFHDENGISLQEALIEGDAGRLSKTVISPPGTWSISINQTADAITDLSLRTDGVTTFSTR